MPTFGFLCKIILQNPEAPSLLRREYAAYLSKPRSLTLSVGTRCRNYSKIDRLKISPLSSATVQTSSNYKVWNRKSFVPSRQISMLDVFRRRKKSDETADVIQDDDSLPSGKQHNSQIFSLDEEKLQLSEEEIEAKRNKSRLGVHHRRFVLGEVPYTEPKDWFHSTLKYKRKMYGTYGEKSGVDPGFLWPTKSELRERLEYEQVCNPFTIEEMVRKKQEQRAAEKAEFEKRGQEIESRMAMVDKLKDELFAKQAEKDNEIEAAKQRREKLMEEVRRHFGYTVDSKDERFKELLEKKEKEQRKAMKEARKVEKQQRMLDKLEGKDASKSVTKDKPKPKVENNDED